MDYLEEQHIIDEALKILETRINYSVNGYNFSSAVDTKSYVKLKLADKQHEVFIGLFLDGQHNLIESVELFKGSVASATIYPREVLKEALRLNAVAVIFAHNHPSGSPVPSKEDRHITQKLKSALSLMDVKVLDHLIVGDSVTSFAERGLL